MLRVGLPGLVQGPGRHRGPEDRQTQEGYPPKQLQLGSPGQDSQRGETLTPLIIWTFVQIINYILNIYLIEITYGLSFTVHLT
jgi:hypothetical protein